MKLLSVVSTDSLGRILIPKDIRERYKLHSTMVEFFFKHPGVYIRIASESSKGIKRKVSQQGRLSIPAMFRDRMGWKYPSNFEIYQHSSDCLFLQMSQNRCSFCSSTDMGHMIVLYGKFICEECLQTALGKRFMLNAHKDEFDDPTKKAGKD